MLQLVLAFLFVAPLNRRRLCYARPFQEAGSWRERRHARNSTAGA